jgi:hypothetical protein
MSTLTHAQKTDLAARAVARWWPLMASLARLHRTAPALAKPSMWITGRLISAEYRLLSIYTLSRMAMRDQDGGHL